MLSRYVGLVQRRSRPEDTLLAKEFPFLGRGGVEMPSAVVLAMGASVLTVCEVVGRDRKSVV